ncbi:hypothetical protein JYK22_31425, partial [Nonomuraea sp. RK-328]|nr:hypothetical protein [Nonomuraea sp. RK-328]
VAVLDVHYKALEECGNAAYRLAKDFDQAYGELKPAAETDAAKLLGKLDGAAALVGQIKKVESETVKKEFGEAADRLRAVEKALDQVQSNVKEADTP